MAAFEIDRQLAEDTILIADWPLCRVLRMRDANYPWLILAPRRPGACDIIDLSPQDQVAMWQEVARATEAMRRHTRAHKMNVAALGNVVRQLHIHVIARFQDDPAWPRPVWGVHPPRRFDAAEADREMARWKDVLAQ